MLKRVWGKCNNIEVTFYWDGSQWTATVPAGNGEYIVELFAEDEAGNSTYMATMLVTYDVSTLRATFKITNISSEYSIEDIREIISPNVKITASINNVVINWCIKEVKVIVSAYKICEGDK